MVMLELDLNSLTDEELDAYLLLKKKAKPVTNWAKKLLDEYYKRYPEAKENGKPKVEDLLGFAPKEQEVITEKGEIKTRRSNEPYWTDEMVSEVYRLKDIRKQSIQNITDEINRKFGMELDKGQIKRKISNLKYRKKWGTHLLLTTTALAGAPHKQSVDEQEVIVRHPKKTPKQKREEYIQKLMKFNNLTRQEAESYIRGEWGGSEQKYPQKKAIVQDAVIKKPVPALPDIKNLNEDSLKILKNMICNLVGRPELTLSFQLEGHMLQLEEYPDWVEFCQDFIAKADTISESMGIDNHFVLAGDGRRGLVIRYKGG